MYSGPKRRIEADEFILRDANGSMRAALTITVDGPGLFLYDQSEVIRAGLLVGKEEPSLTLFDTWGRPRVSLGLAGHDPKLLMRDAKGLPRAALTVEETGTRLMLSDAESGPRVGFATENGEANLVFADPSGKPRVLLGMPGGVPGLTLLDAVGRRRAKLEIEEHTSTFELYDSEGKTSSSSTVAWVEPVQDTAELEAKLAIEAAERKRLEEGLAASEERLSAITAAKAQMEEALRASEEVHSADLHRLEESLRASGERLIEMAAAKAQIEETLRATEERAASERKQLQVLGASQREAKLQALGQLAGGVANGLNNFLTVINGYTDLLLGKVPRSNPMHESVAQIKKAGEQAVDLVAPLLAFSQGQILWTKVLDVNEVVKEVEATLRGKLGEDIRLATELSSTLGPVKADPEQLQQVLMNLAANAAEAMRGGGSLVIETQNADLDESYAAKHPGVKPGPYVHVAVSDSGAGMSEETLAHLFEPFFTTKSPGQGAGLGLATVYGIVKQSGGSIRVESELGRGSTFHVYLPRLGEAVTLAEEEKPAVATQRGTETVLVVDDQEEIRKLAQVVLKSNGYKVVVAANGWEALLYSERHAGPIHLMLTDVVMPGMTGKELAERLRPLRPEMAVVFMSGYLESGTGALNGGAGFLSKPFSPDALATKVREVLGPPRSAGKVLVIDDQAGIRSFLRMVLVSVGYEVLEADNGEQALKNLNGDVVDLILVNLEIPSLQDVEKIRVMQKRHPELKVIAMAEAFGNDFLRAAEQLGAQATLAKPIRADQLLETLRRTESD